MFFSMSHQSGHGPLEHTLQSDGQADHRENPLMSATRILQGDMNLRKWFGKTYASCVNSTINFGSTCTVPLTLKDN